MSKSIVTTDEIVISKIYLIRRKKVMIEGITESKAAAQNWV